MSSGYLITCTGEVTKLTGSLGLGRYMDSWFLLLAGEPACALRGLCQMSCI